MSISFSGVGSGLPIDEWITALVKIKQDKVDALSKDQENLQKKQSTLNTLKSEYNAIQSSSLKFTDSLMGPGSDLFTKVSVSASETSVVTATVTQYATPSAFDLEIKQLASSTVRRSDESDVWRDSSKKLSDLGMTAESGNFEINGATINVTKDMTIDSLIYQINNSSTAGVKASLEKGRLVLKNRDMGDKEIVVTGTDIVGDGKNFAQLIGFDNNDADHLTQGTNAIFKIDGVEKTADTNSLTSDDTGILGLSLELLTTTDTDPDSGAPIPVTIEIERDYDSEAPLTALQEFVDAFNKAIADTDSSTDSGINSGTQGLLYGENNLVYIRNNLRTLVTAQVDNSGIYKSLADIGISTGDPGMSVDADTTKLVIDKDKFLDAYERDPASVKALLIGDNTTGTQTDGIMQKMQSALKSAIDTSGGYFKARSDSLTSEISNLSETIARKQDQVTLYQEQLTKQFNYMDQQIAMMNQQFSQMQQQLASIGVKVGSSS